MTLPDEQRRRLVAARQLLGPAGRDGRTAVDVAEVIGPLHSTDPATAHLQIHARADVGPEDVDRVLYDDRALVRHSTLRRTVHLLTPAMARAAHGAFNHRYVAQSRRQVLEWVELSDEVDEPAEPWLARLEEDVVAAVHDLDRPSGAELAEAVPGLAVTFDAAPGKSYGRRSRLTSFVIQLVIADGRIARDRPRGADWTSSAYTYAPIEDFVPDGLDGLDPPEALRQLVAHHLFVHPGSSDVDLAWWAGLPKGQVRAALAAVDAVELTRDDGVTGHVLPDDDLAVAGEPAAALLPGLDATPMGVKERACFLGVHEAVLFDRTGNIGPTIWWDGRVVGIWTQRPDGEVATRLLEDVGSDVTAAIDVEVDRLTTFLGDVRVNWRYPNALEKNLKTG